MTRKAAWAGGAYGAALLLAAAYRSELNVVLLLTAFGLAALVFAALKNYRRHAVVVILIVAAIITPTQDVFTLLIVSLPIWLLYEASIWIVRVTGKKAKECFFT